MLQFTLRAEPIFLAHVENRLRYSCFASSKNLDYDLDEATRFIARFKPVFDVRGSFYTVNR